MQNMTIRKDKLQEILQENRGKHESVFNDALEGYRAEAIKRLNRRVRDLKAGRVPDLNLGLIEPRNHIRDYDRVLRMLELDITDTWTLNETEVAQLIEDDWGWKRQFLKFSNRYAAASTQAAYGELDDDDTY